MEEKKAVKPQIVSSTSTDSCPASAIKEVQQQQHKTLL